MRSGIVTRPTIPRTAMLLAAGRGERLRPITDVTPKPLITVGGVAMLDRMLDLFDAAGVERAVVNVWHLADRIESHIRGRKTPSIILSREDRRLGTGGGVANALSLLGDEPFFVANSDVVILNGVEQAAHRLAAAWQGDSGDALLLLHNTVCAFGYEGRGDFNIGPDGMLARRTERQVVPYLFTGLQILHPRLFEGCPEGAFSLNRLYDRAQESDRLFGIVHDGEWLHVGTRQALDRVETRWRDLA